jgi:tellurite resistance protein TerC
MMRNPFVGTLKGASRLIVTVLGFTVLLIGLAMVVLPGPAIVVIPLGVAILATEFVWARRPLLRMKTGAGRPTSKLRGSAGERPDAE